jgi:hypothetical protein
MHFYFEPRRADQDASGDRSDSDDTAPGLTGIPAAVLQRFGALVLDPAKAAAVPGYNPPRSTVYRARSLLIPADLLADQNFAEAAGSVLRRVGMALVPPEAAGPGARGDGPVAEQLRMVPRVAVLKPVQPHQGAPVLPVVVDAWVALQALRAAAEAGEFDVLTPDTAGRISLEHLLIGSAITGSPATEGNGISGSPATEGNGVTGPASTDSYVYAGGDTRAPVAVVLDAPRRRPAAELRHRRPVVAVLDTGVRAHPWLDVAPAAPSGYTTVPDGFVAVDHAMQTAIHLEGELALAAGDRPRPLVADAWDQPVSADPLIGELDTETGHGTFIAGLVRQVAPDAQVLAIRIMHSDGVVAEGDLICALGLVAERIALAESGDMAAMIDVVSLSLGYFDESAADVAYSSGLWAVIKVLLSLGVAVVAAAGNYSTSRRFYPAAFSMEPLPAGSVPLISVGARNPNGSAALFSDGGRWITAWATGAAVISTFPVDINGRRCPEIKMRVHPGNQPPGGPPGSGTREALDPDDYRGGFAVWSGTSFAAPLLAANVARSLLAITAEPDLGLDLGGVAAATKRTIAALTSMGWHGHG